MPFPVFFDTCALYGETVCDLTLRLAEAGMFQPDWSSGVLEELERVLEPRIGEKQVSKRIATMEGCFPDACVTNYESLTSMMTCDPNDRHILAAAVASPAYTLVTFNLKDFPESSYRPYQIEIKDPDCFLCDLLDLHHSEVATIAWDLMNSYKKPPVDINEHLGILRRSALPQFSQEIGKALRDFSQHQ